jgi:hypothetical protein
MNDEGRSSGGHLSASEKAQMIFVGAFVMLNLIVPLVIEDLYPFTSAPMFRDRPRQYCNYEVFGSRGERLPNDRFLLQRIYDGNPSGLGVGIKPPPVLEQHFGDVPTRLEVTRHVRQQLARYPDLERVSIVQEVVSAGQGGGLAVERKGPWLVLQDTNVP